MKQEFGITPKIGWMIDNSGHSAINARLFADFGFEAFFMTRLNDDEIKERNKFHNLNFVYQTPSGTETSREILVQMAPDQAGYDYLKGLKFDD